jgi:hypothetical protein
LLGAGPHYDVLASLGYRDVVFGWSDRLRLWLGRDSPELFDELVKGVVPRLDVLLDLVGLPDLHGFVIECYHQSFHNVLLQIMGGFNGV